MQDTQPVIRAAEKTEEELEQYRNVSQSQFAPTPYQEAEWEIVGKPLERIDFSPMEVEIIPSRTGISDEMFDDFGRGVSPKAKAIWHNEKLQNPDEPIVEEAPEFNRELIQAEIDKAFQAGKQEGFAEGMDHAKGEVVENYNQLVERMQHFTLEVNNKIESVFTDVEKHALEFSLSVAKKILETTAEAKPEYIYEVIHKGLNSLGSAKPLRVRVSPQDLEFLEVVGLPEDLQSDELGVRYVGDEGVKGGCIIETDFGELDLQLDAMWEQVAANLFEVYSK